jgi:glycosyltransferase involved in cell wall biosynthesis
MKAVMQATAMGGALAARAKTEAAVEWPRIALVTPVYNSAKYLEATIRSVLAQGYPNLDYFIVDGGSTDGSVEIIRKYEEEISGWVSEPDTGMYDALNKGFARTTGGVMGWISATDMLHTGGLVVAGSVFQQLPEVEWITGLANGFTEEGALDAVYGLRRFSRWRFLAGANKYIQQEGTFWRRSLWEKAGGYVDASRRLACDFELWVRFFRHAQLYPVHALIAGVRSHGDSLGVQELAACHKVHDDVIRAELERYPGSGTQKLIRGLGARMKKVSGLRYAWWRLVERPLMEWDGPDWPPIIAYNGKQWGFRRKSPSKL